LFISNEVLETITMAKLPAHLTQFIGRQRELQEASRLLADPTCHLLTLVGSGGTGKTRLALQIAQEAQSTLADGTVFVSLQSVGSADFLIPAIADALDFSLSDQSEPLIQVGGWGQSLAAGRSAGDHDRCRVGSRRPCNGTARLEHRRS
jgi:hypothetical protein